MLAHTLRELQLDGLIVRTSHPVVPPRTEYHLTDSGREVAGLVRALVRAGSKSTCTTFSTRANAHKRRERKGETAVGG